MRLTLFLIFFPCFIFAQKKSFTTQLNFEKLFNGTWDSTNKEIIWTPNFEESMFFYPDENKKCYTSILEEIEYKDNLYVIFITYDKELEFQYCHFCENIIGIAKYNFDKDNKQWNISAFTKNVGIIFTDSHSDFRILEIGKHVFIKKTLEVQINHYRTTSITLYNNFDRKFASVFSYLQEMSSGIPEEGETYSTFLTDNDKKVVLEIEDKSLELEGESDKIIIKKTREVYHISEEGKFILQAQ